MESHERRDHPDVCPYTPWTVAMLDNVVRTVFQNPDKIVGDCISPGMTSIDIGCGPGFFTLAMAQMVGPGGTVIAIDIQKEMLDLVRMKSEQQGLSDSIRFHQCRPDSLGITEKAGFILSFYMVHEVPDRKAFFTEVYGLLEDSGRYLIVEPVFHVSKIAFDEMLEDARGAGFLVGEQPKFRTSRAAVLVKT